MYVEVDNFNYHNYIAFGFDCEHIESAVFVLLHEQFDKDLIGENRDDIVLEIERHYEAAEKDLSQTH